VCRLATAQFEADSSSPVRARRLVIGCLQRWELPELIEVASLLTSELVTNSVVRTGAGPSVVLAVADGVLEVGVNDFVRRLPSALDARVIGPETLHVTSDLLGVGGLGLVLVESLADEWGGAILEERKQVWFRLNTGGWSYRSACGCHADVIDRVRLDSGRYALAMAGPWDTP